MHIYWDVLYICECECKWFTATENIVENHAYAFTINLLVTLFHVAAMIWTSSNRKSHYILTHGYWCIINLSDYCIHVENRMVFMQTAPALIHILIMIQQWYWFCESRYQILIWICMQQLRSLTNVLITKFVNRLCWLPRNVTPSVLVKKRKEKKKKKRREKLMNFVFVR